MAANVESVGGSTQDMVGPHSDDEYDAQSIGGTTQGDRYSDEEDTTNLNVQFWRNWAVQMTTQTPIPSDCDLGEGDQRGIVADQERVNEFFAAFIESSTDQPQGQDGRTCLADEQSARE